MGDSFGDTPSIRAQWASRLVREKLYLELNKINENQRASQTDHESPFAFLQAAELLPGPITPGDLLGVAPSGPFNLPRDVQPVPGSHPDDGSHGLPEPGGFRGIGPDEPISAPEEHRICIIGAGVTGLYIAMILDSLGIPGLEYDILEASNRTGGRLYTHYFSDTPHDYYDIGAMRFPKITIMDTTFELFKKLKIPLIPYYLNHESTKPPGKGSVNCPTMLNDKTVIDGEEPVPDPFGVSVANGGSVPNDTVDNVTNLLDEAFGPFKDEMAKGFENGFKILKKYDEYSTREFLKNPPPPEKDWKPWTKHDFFTIQWLETNNTSTNLFEQAFSESVIDSFDFASPEETQVEEWKCIDGGTTLVSDAMESIIKQPIQHCKRVHKVTQDPRSKEITISVIGEPEGSRAPYTTVFNTTSLACLQRIDLTSLQLHPTQKDAIRSLHYDDSAKVAIKFEYPWWITQCGITTGGIASTDIPLRTCVYPSYNINDDPKDSSILLCSYTWSQDASRIGSLIARRSPEDETELRELMFDNLARLHLKNFQSHWPDPDNRPNLTQVRRIISGAYVSHHAFSWSHDPFTSGAFALFGPGQFTNLYPYLSRPAADSRFHICGEASSAHHAWIVGSLDSALASVYRFARRFKMWDVKAALKEKWGTPEELEDDVDGTLHLQVALGMLPEKYMVQV